MEYPHLQEIYAKRAGNDFAILSVEVSNRPEMAKKFVSEVGATFPIVLDEQKTARNLFALKGVPTNLLIDRSGNIIFRHVGFSPGDEKVIDAEVQYLVEKSPVAGTEMGELLR